MKYILGLTSISFRAQTPDEILKIMQDCGLDRIEWGSDVHCPPERAEEISSLTKQYGITCCSYGTYFRLGVTPVEELHSYINAARILGTKILRLWCGHKNSQDYAQRQKAELFAACKAAAKMAEDAGVILCMECHNNTYTNNKEAAYELMQEVDSKHFRMYWQPNQYISEEQNMAYAELLSPFTEHLHVFNWKGNKKYPLCDGKETWKAYLSRFDKGKTLLLEFMPDGKIETLKYEVLALKEIAE